MMKRITKIINRIVETMLMALFGLMVINVLWQVISRYMLSQASSFTEELARFSLIWLTMLGAAYLTGKKEHISIDYFYQKFSQKRQIWIAKGVELVVALFAFSVMIIGGGNLVWITLQLGQQSPALHLPMGFVYAIVPFSGFLILYYSLANFLHLSRDASTEKIDQHGTN